MSTMNVVTMKHNIILGQQQDTVVISVPEYKINQAKTNQKPTKQNPTQSVEYNRLHRPESDFVTKPTTENEAPQKAVTIATTKEATTIITKRKPKHTRMQPMTRGQRRTINQKLQKTTLKTAVKEVADEYKFNKSQVYQLALRIKNEQL